MSRPPIVPSACCWNCVPSASDCSSLGACSCFVPGLFSVVFFFSGIQLASPYFFCLLASHPGSFFILSLIGGLIFVFHAHLPWAFRCRFKAYPGLWPTTFSGWSFQWLFLFFAAFLAFFLVLFASHFDFPFFSLFHALSSSFVLADVLRARISPGELGLVELGGSFSVVALRRKGTWCVPQPALAEAHFFLFACWRCFLFLLFGQGRRIRLDVAMLSACAFFVGSRYFPITSAFLLCQFSRLCSLSSLSVSSVFFIVGLCESRLLPAVLFADSSYDLTASLFLSLVPGKFLKMAL